MITKIQNTIANLFELLFPYYCVECGKIGTTLCSKCANLLTPNLPECYICRRINSNFDTHQNCFITSSISTRSNPVFKSMFVGWNYNEVPTKLMSEFKYNGIKEIAKRVIAFKIKDITNFLSKLEQSNNKIILIPTPLHFLRQSERGFNQSSVIANEIISQSLHTKLKSQLIIEEKLILKIYNTEHQAWLSLKQRKFHEKVKSPFEIVPVLSQKYTINDIFIIVDDVMTTGNTIEKVGDILNKAGFTNLHGIVLFRGKPNFQKEITK